MLLLIPALHLLCVSVGTSGPLVCLWLEWREGRGSELAGHVGRRLALSSLALLIVGILLGFLLGWFVWSPQLRQALVLLNSRITYGLVELAFSLILMATQVIWWHAGSKSSAWQRWARMGLLLLAGTNLLYHFPFLFVILTDLAGQNLNDREPLASSEFRHAMMQGEILARTVHFWLASLAVTGVFVIGDALYGSRHRSEECTRRVATWGGRIAIVPTLLQFPVGIWLLSELPQGVMRRFMGGQLLATLLLALGVAGVLWLLHQLAAVATGSTSRATLWRSVVSMLIVYFLMVGTARHVRRSSGLAERSLRPPTANMAPQFGNRQ